MKKIKIFAFIGMLTIAYIIGGIMGFALCASTQVANAKVESIQNVQNMQYSVNTQTIYIDGKKYTVFTSGSTSMFVIKN